MTRFYERPFVLKLCWRCAQPVLDGASDGFDEKVDPYALTARGELAALIDGRTTFTVHAHGAAIRMFARAAWDMAARALPIVARHTCGAGPLEHDRDLTRRTFIDALLPRQEHTECPF